MSCWQGAAEGVRRYWIQYPAALAGAGGTTAEPSSRAGLMSSKSLWTCGGCSRVFTSFRGCNMHVTKAAPRSSCRTRAIVQHEVAGEPHVNQQHVGLPSRHVHGQGAGHLFQTFPARDLIESICVHSFMSSVYGGEGACVPGCITPLRPVLKAHHCVLSVLCRTVEENLT